MLLQPLLLQLQVLQALPVPGQQVLLEVLEGNSQRGLHL